MYTFVVQSRRLGQRIGLLHRGRGPDEIFQRKRARVESEGQ